MQDRLGLVVVHIYQPGGPDDLGRRLRKHLNHHAVFVRTKSRHTSQPGLTISVHGESWDRILTYLLRSAVSRGSNDGLNDVCSGSLITIKYFERQIIAYSVVVGSPSEYTTRTKISP